MGGEELESSAKCKVELSTIIVAAIFRHTVCSDWNGIIKAKWRTHHRHADTETIVVVPTRTALAGVDRVSALLVDKHLISGKAKVASLFVHESTIVEGCQAEVFRNAERILDAKHTVGLASDGNRRSSRFICVYESILLRAHIAVFETA